MKEKKKTKKSMGTGPKSKPIIEGTYKDDDGIYNRGKKPNAELYEQLIRQFVVVLKGSCGDKDLLDEETMEQRLRSNYPDISSALDALAKLAMPHIESLHENFLECTCESNLRKYPPDFAFPLEEKILEINPLLEQGEEWRGEYKDDLVKDITDYFFALADVDFNLRERLHIDAALDSAFEAGRIYERIRIRTESKPLQDGQRRAVKAVEYASEKAQQQKPMIVRRNEKIIGEYELLMEKNPHISISEAARKLERIVLLKVQKEPDQWYFDTIKAAIGQESIKRIIKKHKNNR